MVVVPVRLTPRAGRDSLEGPAADGVLRARVAAAPVDGAANRALIRLVAEALGVPAGDVVVVSGASARRKRLRVSGVTRADLLERWPGLSLGR